MTSPEAREVVLAVEGMGVRYGRRPFLRGREAHRDAGVRVRAAGPERRGKVHVGALPARPAEAVGRRGPAVRPRCLGPSRLGDAPRRRRSRGARCAAGDDGRPDLRLRAARARRDGTRRPRASGCGVSAPPTTSRSGACRRARRGRSCCRWRSRTRPSCWCSTIRRSASTCWPATPCSRGDRRPGGPRHDRLRHHPRPRRRSSGWPTASGSCRAAGSPWTRTPKR